LLFGFHLKFSLKVSVLFQGDNRRNRYPRACKKCFVPKLLPEAIQTPFSLHLAKKQKAAALECCLPSAFLSWF